MDNPLPMDDNLEKVEADPTAFEDDWSDTSSEDNSNVLSFHGISAASIQALQPGSTETSGMEETIGFSEVELKILRRNLQIMGVGNFIRHTVAELEIDPRYLLQAFDPEVAKRMESEDDGPLFRALITTLSRASSRQKLPQYNTIKDVADLIQSASNILVLTGAGISTSLGIPDFRSKDVGLYAQLADKGLSEPEEVFDLEHFERDPSIFFGVAKDILPSTERYTPTHAFIRLLQDRNKLLRNYTQNIDNIESHAGINAAKFVQCHGSFATATCRLCRHKVQGDSIFEAIKAGNIPRCKICMDKYRERQAQRDLKRKRKGGGNGPNKNQKRDWDASDVDEEDDVDSIETSVGILKPDIIFFGEDLGDGFHDQLMEDLPKTDLVLCIGTSLAVAPVAKIVRWIPEEIPQIFISRTPVEHENFDVELLCDQCDWVVYELCRLLEWEIKHPMLEEAGPLKLQVLLQEGHESRYNIIRQIPEQISAARTCDPAK